MRPLLSAPGNIDLQDVLPDGRVLVDDVLARLVLMVSTPDQKKDRDFTWMDWAYGERFSADGKQILFGDQHSGDMYGTFLRNMDGSPAVRLGDGDPDDISADGKWAISTLPTDPKQLMLLPTGAGEQRQLTHSKINHERARWLADGRIVAIGNESGHVERTYLIDQNGNETPITDEGVTGVAATTDGKRLLVRSGPGAFQIMPITGGPAQPVTQLQKGDVPLDFTPDDTAIHCGALSEAINSRDLARGAYRQQENSVAHDRIIGSTFGNDSVGSHSVARWKKLCVCIWTADVYGICGGGVALGTRESARPGRGTATAILRPS